MPAGSAVPIAAPRTGNRTISISLSPGHALLTRCLGLLSGPCTVGAQVELTRLQPKHSGRDTSQWADL